MRTRTQLLAGASLIAIAWGSVAISIANGWPERVHEAIIGAAGCITATIAIAFIAVGNRHVYHRDHDNLRAEFDALRRDVDTAIKASNFGRVLKDAGNPLRATIPNQPVHSVPITGENAIIGVRKGSVIDIDAAKRTIRHTES